MNYLVVIEGKEGKYSAYAPDIPGANGTGKTLAAVKRSVAESISLHCEGKYPKAKVLTREQAEKHALKTFALALSPDDRIDFVEAAAMNPVSLEIETARESLGISQAELGRRLGMPRSNISRLENPFYFGHSLAVLTRIAKVLDKKLEIRFEQAA